MKNRKKREFNKWNLERKDVRKKRYRVGISNSLIFAHLNLIDDSPITHHNIDWPLTKQPYQRRIWREQEIIHTNFISNLVCSTLKLNFRQSNQYAYFCAHFGYLMSKSNPSTLLLTINIIIEIITFAQLLFIERAKRFQFSPKYFFFVFNWFVIWLC